MSLVQLFIEKFIVQKIICKKRAVICIRISVQGMMRMQFHKDPYSISIDYLYKTTTGRPQLKASHLVTVQS